MIFYDFRLEEGTMKRVQRLHSVIYRVLQTSSLD